MMLGHWDSGYTSSLMKFDQPYYFYSNFVDVLTVGLNSLLNPVLYLLRMRELRRVSLWCCRPQQVPSQSHSTNLSSVVIINGFIQIHRCGRIAQLAIILITLPWNRHSLWLSVFSSCRQKIKTRFTWRNAFFFQKLFAFLNLSIFHIIKSVGHFLTGTHTSCIIVWTQNACTKSWKKSFQCLFSVMKANKLWMSRFSLYQVVTFSE